MIFSIPGRAFRMAASKASNGTGEQNFPRLNILDKTGASSVP